MAFARTLVRAPLLAVMLSGATLLGGVPALAQPNQQPNQQQWFVPPGQEGGTRPAQSTPRPPGQPQPGQPQRPPQRPAALPAGQPPPTAVIGIVDIPEIQRESTALNQVREEIERRRQKLNDDLQREQTAWRDAQQQLANQRATLPPEQLRQRERDLQERITESQRIFRERSRSIEQVAQAALIEIEQALGGVIRQVASSRSVNLVVTRPLVIFNDPGFDLTAEVAQQFNRQLRSVTMPPEGTPVAGGETAQPAAAQPTPRPAPAPAPAPQPARR